MDNNSNAPESEEISTSKLVVRGNILAYDSTVFQVSNISTVSVKEVVTTVNYKRPLSPFFWAIFGGTLIYLWNNERKFTELVESILKELGWPEGVIIAAAIVVLLFTIGSIIEIFSFKSQVSTSRTFLMVEMNSGRRALFSATDKGFMLKAAGALTRVMSAPPQLDERVVLNFDNKTINIGKAENSNIIGGNVSDSVVNSI